MNRFLARTAPAFVAAAAALVSVPVLTASPACAQSNPGWFVPKSAAPPAQAPEPGPRRVRHAAPEPVAPASQDQGPDQSQASAPTQPPVLPLPPVPAITELPKGAAPPAAIVGVISVPDIMRASTAAEQVQKVLGARRDKLSEDVHKEQMVWRDMQASLQDAKNLTQDQARTRGRALQQRVLSAQGDFKNRQRVIQEAAQVALGQIERELVQVIRQVASSHGMNLVLHQEQIALNVQGFDITPQVVSQLNSVLPSVFIPADGVDPEQLAKDGTFPTSADPGKPVQAVSAPGPAPAAK